MPYDPLNGVGYEPSKIPLTQLVAEGFSLTFSDSRTFRITAPKPCVVLQCQIRLTFTQGNGPASVVNFKYNDKVIQALTTVTNGQVVDMYENFGFLAGANLLNGDYIEVNVSRGAGVATSTDYTLSMILVTIEK